MHQWGKLRRSGSSFGVNVVVLDGRRTTPATMRQWGSSSGYFKHQQSIIEFHFRLHGAVIGPLIGGLIHNLSPVQAPPGAIITQVDNALGGGAISCQGDLYI